MQPPRSVLEYKTLHKNKKKCNRQRKVLYKIAVLHLWLKTLKLTCKGVHFLEKLLAVGRQLY